MPAHRTSTALNQNTPAARVRSVAACITLFTLVPAKPACAEWTLAGYLGGTHTQSTDLTIRNPASNTDVRFSLVDYRSDSFGSPPYYGYRIGYFLSSHPRMGFEGEFIHMKAFAETERAIDVDGRLAGRLVRESVRMNDLVQRFSLSHGLNFVLLNLAFRQALSHAPSGSLPRVWIEMRSGAGFTVPHAESTIGGRAREGYELGSPGVQVGGTLRIRLTAKISGLGEYKLTATRQSVGIVGGRAGSLFVSHHGVFGLAYQF